MKRKDSHDQLPEPYSYQNVLASLKFFDRFELLNIINESNNYLATECSNLTSSLPEEIWKSMFCSHASNDAMRIHDPWLLNHRETMKKNRKSIVKLEIMFRSLSVVSRSWANSIRELVQVYFKYYMTQSNWILNQFPNISSLELDYTNINDQTLKRLTNLHSLVISEGNDLITSEGIRDLTNLTDLSIEGDKIHDDAFFRLTNLIKLTIGKDYNTNDTHTWTNDAFKTLSNLTYLDARDLESQISEEIFNYLPNLLFLNPSHYMDLFALTMLTNLKSLRCPELFPSELCLLQLTNLTFLDLKDQMHADDEQIQGLVNLKTLNLSDCTHVTNAGLASLTQLESLTLQNNDQVNNEGLMHLTNLTKLSLSEQDEVTGQVFQHLPLLTDLCLSYNDSIRDEDIIGLTNLARLDLSNENLITNNALKHLTQLKSLSLYNNPNIYGEGLKNNLVNLTSLDIGKNKIFSPDHLNFCPNLIELNLKDNNHFNSVWLREIPLPKLKNVIGRPYF